MKKFDRVAENMKKVYEVLRELQENLPTDLDSVVLDIDGQEIEIEKDSDTPVLILYREGFEQFDIGAWNINE